MTAKERLDNKFKEVLEKRDELADRMEVQEETLCAAERVMDIFGCNFVDGMKVQEIKMDNPSVDRFVFRVKAADGRFYSEHKCFSEDLKKALKLAEYSVDEVIKDWMLEILDEYFEISEDTGTVIRI